jgi:hypothetical protein
VTRRPLGLFIEGLYLQGPGGMALTSPSSFLAALGAAGERGAQFPLIGLCHVSGLSACARASSSHSLAVAVSLRASVAALSRVLSIAS